MENTEVYYLKDNNGRKIGPLKVNDLAKYNVSKATYIWREGLQDWVLVSDLPEANNLLRKIPPPDVADNNSGCGLDIAFLALSFALSFVIPFFWFIVGCLIIYIIGKLLKK